MEKRYAIVDVVWCQAQSKYKYDFTSDTQDAIDDITEDCAIGSTMLITGNSNGVKVFYKGVNGFVEV